MLLVTRCSPLCSQTGAHQVAAVDVSAHWSGLKDQDVLPSFSCWRHALSSTMVVWFLVHLTCKVSRSSSNCNLGIINGINYVSLLLIYYFSIHLHIYLSISTYHTHLHLFLHFFTSVLVPRELIPHSLTVLLSETPAC